MVVITYQGAGEKGSWHALGAMYAMKGRDPLATCHVPGTQAMLTRQTAAADARVSDSNPLTFLIQDIDALPTTLVV